MNNEIDWSALPFGYLRTDYNVRCEYRDGKWGEIQFDFVSGTAEIVRLAEWDTMVSKVFAERAVKYIRSCDIEYLPKMLLLMF